MRIFFNSFVLVSMRRLILLFSLLLSAGAVAVEKIGYVSPGYFPLSFTYDGSYFVSHARKGKFYLFKNIGGKYKKVRVFDCSECTAGISEYYLYLYDVQSATSALKVVNLNVSGLDSYLMESVSGYDGVSVSGHGIFWSVKGRIYSYDGMGGKPICSSEMLDGFDELLGVDEVSGLYAFKKDNNTFVADCNGRVVNLAGSLNLLDIANDAIGYIENSAGLRIQTMDGKVNCEWSSDTLSGVNGGEFVGGYFVVYDDFRVYLINYKSGCVVNEYSYRELMPGDEEFKLMHVSVGGGYLLLVHSYGYVFRLLVDELR